MKLFNKGDILKTTGLDMNCNTVDVDVEFVKYLDVRTNTGFDCVILEEGICIFVNSEDLS